MNERPQDRRIQQEAASVTMRSHEGAATTEAKQFIPVEQLTCELDEQIQAAIDEATTLVYDHKRRVFKQFSGSLLTS